MGTLYVLVLVPIHLVLVPVHLALVPVLVPVLVLVLVPVPVPVPAPVPALVHLALVLDASLNQGRASCLSSSWTSFCGIIIGYVDQVC